MQDKVLYINVYKYEMKRLLAGQYFELSFYFLIVWLLCFVCRQTCRPYAHIISHVFSRWLVACVNVSD